MANLHRLALALTLCALHPACGSDKTTIVQGGSGELGNMENFPQTGAYSTTFEPAKDDCGGGTSAARRESRLEYTWEPDNRIRFVLPKEGPEVYRGQLTPGPRAGSWSFNARADNLFGLSAFSGTITGELTVPTVTGRFVVSQTSGCRNGAGSVEFAFMGPRVP